jgi:hypothetical protein
MSEAALQTILPNKEGKVYFANLHEGIFGTYFTILAIYLIILLLSSQHSSLDQSNKLLLYCEYILHITYILHI